MWLRITCDHCGTTLEYNNKSIWEGNRDREEIHCPVCNNIVGYVFTDLIPEVRIVEKGPDTKDKN